MNLDLRRIINRNLRSVTVDRDQSRHTDRLVFEDFFRWPFEFAARGILNYNGEILLRERLGEIEKCRFRLGGVEITSTGDKAANGVGFLSMIFRFFR